MALSELKSGALVSLQELHPSSPFFKDGASLRIVGKLHEYSVETALATVIDGDASLKVNTQHLRDLSFRVGSVYQFIGELLIQPDNKVFSYEDLVQFLLHLALLAFTLGHKGVLQARVGRNVDGIDLNLYQQSLLLVRQFQADHLNNQAD